MQLHLGVVQLLQDVGELSLDFTEMPPEERQKLQHGAQLCLGVDQWLQDFGELSLDDGQKHPDFGLRPQKPALMSQDVVQKRLRIWFKVAIGRGRESWLSRHRNGRARYAYRAGDLERRARSASPCQVKKQPRHRSDQRLNRGGRERL